MDRWECYAHIVIPTAARSSLSPTVLPRRHGLRSICATVAGRDCGSELQRRHYHPMTSMWTDKRETLDATRLELHFSSFSNSLPEFRYTSLLQHGFQQSAHPSTAPRPPHRQREEVRSPVAPMGCQRTGSTGGDTHPVGQQWLWRDWYRSTEELGPTRYWSILHPRSCNRDRGRSGCQLLPGI
jgi:hypothetical protein